MFERIALVGIGLIGSSIARAVRERNLARHVATATRSARTLEEAERLRLGDSFHLDAREAVRGADLVVVSVPVGASGAVAAHIAPALGPGTILTDVGSTKASVIEAMAPHVPDGVHFIPGHPIAGTERSGPSAGFPTLFENRWCLLTPLPGTDANALSRLAAFWEAMGSRIDTMTPQHHDRVLAIVSHLPHIIAYSITGTADDLETVTESEVIAYSASGFPTLFENRWCLLTPPPGTDESAIERLSAFWRALGSRIDRMTPEHHDRVLAIVSHLPHIIAYSITGTADDLETVTESEVIAYSASGFRDFTRLAASDPVMWRDVCLHNRDAILEMLARFTEDLIALQRHVRWGNADDLEAAFPRPRRIRRSIIEAGQEVDAPDFGRRGVPDGRAAKGEAAE